jgi:DNA-directed RNA polymerase subunit M
MFPDKGIMKCRRCGFEEKASAANRPTVKAEMREDAGLLIVDGRADTLPKTQIRCPKCGNNEAFWVLRQTRAADEPETRIYRCTRCSHSWREY